MAEQTPKSEAGWRKHLTPEQYRILREQGTEPPFSGEHWDRHEPGTYRCAGCGSSIFSSEAKFDSGTGWPSFIAPLKLAAIELHEDRAHGMHRTEVVCRRCGSHLGHVFDDGPPPTGQRYCINSAALAFEPTTAERTAR